MATGSRRVLAAAALAGLLLSIPLAGQASAATTPKPRRTLSALVKQVRRLPRSAAPERQRAKLVATAGHAQRVARRRPCVAVSDLVRFRRTLKAIKVRRAERFHRAMLRLGALGPASLRASQALLAQKRTKRCGGGVAPSTRPEARTKVLKSDENGMTLRVQLPKLIFSDAQGGGHTWTKLAMPDTDVPGKPGTPGIPFVSSDYAVPDGASVHVQTTGTTSYTLKGVSVYPAQPDPVDADPPKPNFFGGPFKTPPFTLDGKAYKHDGPVPAQPAEGGILGKSRDVLMGNLQVPGARYNPASGSLKVLTAVKLKIAFNGGPHTFNPELGSPYELPQLHSFDSLLNSALLERLRNPGILRRCGEQMLIITNPATQAAADQLATARRAAGFRTTVVQVGTGAGQIGDTPTAIQTYIRDQLTRLLCIHPSYITILGDDDLVPTFTNTPGSIPSDLPYAMRDDTDELPDVAVGRIIGNDQAAVGTAVTKIVGYETAPPGGPWLRHATVAAQFQDDNTDGQEERTFVQFAETVRNGLVGRGLTVDRVYHDAPTTNPTKFNDGSSLPASLQKPTFAWDGTAADVVNDWNDGRFLMVHRDHGWSDGWGTPGVGTADVDALHNGAMLPVLLSINCSSAAYDYDETSFVGESLVNPNGGAVGAFGDTRDSPTWHNTQIALGFADALLPSILPSEGPATKQRTGDALINGKLRLAGLAPPSSDGNTRAELYLWHYFGDPSMQMWGGDPPLTVRPEQITAVYEAYNGPPMPDPPPYQVAVTLPVELAGQTVSLLRNGQVIGKAFIGPDGTATVPAAFGDGSVKPGDLQVALEPDGGTPAQAPVAGVPVRTSPKTDTTLTQSCPGTISNAADATVTGTLAPAFAGAQVTVRWTRPDGSTFERTTTTDANGNWSQTIDTGAEYPNGGNGGTWSAQARFEGDDTHNPSQAASCSFRELPN